MTTRSDDEKQDDRLLRALNETWADMDATFTAEPVPLPDWTALVRERKRLAKRKMWKELAILWSVAVPLLGVMVLMISGMQTVFWILQAAATAAVIPWLVTEFKHASGSGGRGGIAP